MKKYHYIRNFCVEVKSCTRNHLFMSFIVEEPTKIFASLIMLKCRKILCRKSSAFFQELIVTTQTKYFIVGKKGQPNI